MNLAHLKYAVEIANTGSLNKAAEKLFIGQPNLSRAVKELENSLGVAIFDRSAKGMLLTSDGKIFIRYAKSILEQVDAVEALFADGSVQKKHFSVSVAHAGYIAEAFAKFSAKLPDNEELELRCREAETMQTIRNVCDGQYQLGIIRYAEMFDQYYKNFLEEKGLRFELITEFYHVAAMNKTHPLANRDEISLQELSDFPEISLGDPYTPALTAAHDRKTEPYQNGTRKFFVTDRADQLELLAQHPAAVALLPPLPKELCDRFSLVQKNCRDNKQLYKDMLIFSKDYALDTLDKQFISEVCNARRAAFAPFEK